MKLTYRVERGKRIDGALTMAFIHNGEYQLTPISIYQDGKVECSGLVSFEHFKQKVRSGIIVTQPPKGAKITVGALADFKAASDAAYPIEPEEFIKEVSDIIERLNGRPTASQICWEAWERFERCPSEDNRDALRGAYEAIAKHKRSFVLGDLNSKDWPICQAIYGYLQ